MCEAAVAMGRAMNYTNAGTVEFLLAPSGEFYFIEVNTRIQVEHPVTELVTNLDLIRLQIAVAEGRRVDLNPAEPSGHAIEARLYAEQPGNGFLPSMGVLHVWRPAGGIRIDSGVEEGTEIAVHYDGLLAKVIAWAEDRDSAIRKLAYALRATAVGGVETNREYLIQALEHQDFREGRAHTGWSLAYERCASHDSELAQAAVDCIAAADQGRRTVLQGVPAYWRNNPFREPSIIVEAVGGSVHVCRPNVARADAHPGVRVYPAGDAYYVHSVNGAATFKRVPRFPAASATSRHETASSPMPGQVLRIVISEGQSVRRGDPLVVLEAMKMEQTIRTVIDGRVTAILVKPGQVVAPGQMLIEISSENDNDEPASHTAGVP